MSDAANAFEKTQADLRDARRQISSLRGQAQDLMISNIQLRREAEVQDGAFARCIDEHTELEDRIIACAAPEDFATLKKEILDQRKQGLDMFRQSIEVAKAKMGAAAESVDRVLARFSAARGAMYEAGIDRGTRDTAQLELERYLDAEDIEAAEKYGVIQRRAAMATVSDVWQLTPKGLAMIIGRDTVPVEGAAA